MSEKTFVTVFDTNAQPVRLHLEHVSSFKVTEDGATVTLAEGEKVDLSVEQATNLGAYLYAMTHRQEPLITK